MSTPFLGEIRMFAGNYAPVNWQFCNGQTLNISQYTALFSLIGTTYGGNGVQTFQLPNLQGRIPVGEGSGPGLTPRVIGTPAGGETVTITPQTLPMHNHPFMATSAAATANLVGSSVLTGAVVPPVTGDMYASNVGTPPVTFGTLTPQSLAATGGGQPHTNLMPTLCVSFIIAMAGLFPTRN